MGGGRGAVVAAQYKGARVAPLNRFSLSPSGTKYSLEAFHHLASVDEWASSFLPVSERKEPTHTGWWLERDTKTCKNPV
jgi:hypothetical protein